MMMQHARIESKAGIQEQVNALIELVESGVRSGEAAHTMERSSGTASSYCSQVKPPPGFRATKAGIVVNHPAIIDSP